LKQAIAALKYHNQPQLAEPLGLWMAQAWAAQSAGIRSAIVVPIPMHRQKQQQRGFNQAEKLAESFCVSTGLTLKANGLTRIRATEAQFNLSIAARQQNLQDAFCLGSALAKRSSTQPIFLLDDIYTTGATVQAAMQTLRAHNIQVKGIVVLAIAERTPPSAPLV
jgi:ComF family protein